MRAFWIALMLLVIAGVWFVLSPRAVVIDHAAPIEGETVVESPPPSPTEVVAKPEPEIDLLGEDGVVVAPAEGSSKVSPTDFLSNVLPIPDVARPLKIDTRAPSDVVRRLDDRTLVLDDRFTVRGNGSASDPYIITWELLTSASEYIDPARGAKTPPPWVRLLDGTYIEISGYYSSAIRVSFAKNLLLTLNRWDGCCIGVPPTPFDAIDIAMREPLSMRGLHLTRFGTFRGLLRVELIETAGFVLGLYRLEDGTFETK